MYLDILYVCSQHRIKNILPSYFGFCTGARIRVFFDDRIAIRTLNFVSREWYREKILEKIPSVPLTETYQLNHLTSNLVP